MNLEIQRRAYVRTQRDERRIEAFEMPDLKDGAAAFSRRDH